MSSKYRFVSALAVVALLAVIVSASGVGADGGGGDHTLKALLNPKWVSKEAVSQGAQGLEAY
jgi:hypothetical protein